MLHKDSGLSANITVIVTDPNNPERTIAYYPKSYADGVYLDYTKTYTFRDHIDNAVDEHIHLNRAFRELLSKRPDEGGLVKLDDNALIPGEYINPSCIVLYVEFDTINDLLVNNTFDPVEDYGRLVLINDVSTDPRTSINTPRWGIYRLVGPDTRDVYSYQRIITEAEFDRTADWSEFSDLFQSTVEEIDKAVLDSHNHTNHSVLEKLFTMGDGYLYYRGMRISFRNDFQTIVVTTDPEMHGVMPKDIVFLVTDTRDKTIYPEVEPIEPILVLSGNCDNLYRGNTDLTVGPKIRTNLVTSANGMFAECNNMRSIPWYSTRSIRSANMMLRGCSSLQSIPAISFESMETAEEFAANSGIKSMGDIMSARLINAKGMLKNCTRLVNVGIINIGMAKDTSYFFYGDTALKELKTYIHIELCEDSSHMFEGCTALKIVEHLSTPRVKLMTDMFKGCTDLRTVNYIDFTDVVDATGMFDGCPNLKRVVPKPASITTNLSFENTSLDIDSIRTIIKGLGVVSTHTTINFRNTPGIDKLTDQEISSLVIAGWTIIR